MPTANFSLNCRIRNERELRGEWHSTKLVFLKHILEIEMLTKEKKSNSDFGPYRMDIQW